MRTRVESLPHFVLESCHSTRTERDSAFTETKINKFISVVRWMDFTKEVVRNKKRVTMLSNSVFLTYGN